MKVIIHWSHGDFEDSLVISGETVEDIRTRVQFEMKKRGWKEEDCWSEKIAD